MNNISKHISYKEATYSNTAKRLGISNDPSECQLHNMEIVAKMIFEPIRIHFATPIHVSSMYRSDELNKAIGGSKSSQHLANNGTAIDIDADKYGNVTNEEIFEYIKDNMTFDQLIAESVEDGHVSWVHVSYKAAANRNQILIMYKEDGKSKYLPYTEENYNKYIK